MQPSSQPANQHIAKIVSSLLKSEIQLPVATETLIILKEEWENFSELNVRYLRVYLSCLADVAVWAGPCCLSGYSVDPFSILRLVRTLHPAAAVMPAMAINCMLHALQATTIPITARHTCVHVYVYVPR